MESTFDIEATRIPESKQKQRVDILQHALHNIIRTENERMNSQVYRLDEKPLGEQKVNKRNKDQIEQIQDRSFVRHFCAESSWNMLQKGFAIPGSA